SHLNHPNQAVRAAGTRSQEFATGRKNQGMNSPYMLAQHSAFARLRPTEIPQSRCGVQPPRGEGVAARAKCQTHYRTTVAGEMGYKLGRLATSLGLGTTQINAGRR